MTIREMRNCACCGGAFRPKQGRSRYCDHPNCKRFASKESNVIPRFTHAPRDRSYSRNFERVCESCGCPFKGTQREQFCQKDQCREEKRKRHLYRATLYSRSQKAKEHQARINALSKNEEAPREIRERVMEGWINTIFTEHDQVELIFLECQHLRGRRDGFISALLTESGGTWGCILPNRGGRS